MVRQLSQKTVRVFLSSSDDGYWWSYFRDGPWKGPVELSSKEEFEAYVAATLSDEVSFYWVPKRREKWEKDRDRDKMTLPMRIPLIGAYRLTPDVHIFSVFGKVVSFTYAQAKTVVASRGTSAVAGRAIAFARPRSVSLLRGTSSVLGRTASFVRARTLAVSRGSLAAVGKAAGLTKVSGGGTAYSFAAAGATIPVSGKTLTSPPAAGNLLSTSFASSVSPWTEATYPDPGPDLPFTPTSVVTGFFSGSARIVAATGKDRPHLSYQIPGLIPGEQYQVVVPYSNKTPGASLALIALADRTQGSTNGNPTELNRNVDSSSTTSGTITLYFVACSSNYIRLGLASLGGSGDSIDLASVTVSRSFKGGTFSANFWRRDQRPICSDFVSEYNDRTFPNNPRGFFGSTLSDAGNPTQLDNAAQAHANAAAQAAVAQGAQGIVIWNLPGGEFRHNTNYIGAPDELSVWAPELEATIVGVPIVDRFISTIKSYGLRVGVCLRPQRIPYGTVLPTLPDSAYPELAPFVKTNNAPPHRMQVASENPPGTWAWYDWEAAHPDIGAGQEPIRTGTDKNNARQRVLDRITYCKNRWGMTLFYVDSTVWENGDALDTIGFWDTIRAAHPDVLIMPENETYGAYDYTVPYGEFRVGDQSPANAFFPSNHDAQMILSIAQGPQDWYSAARQNIIWQVEARRIVPLYYWADPLGRDRAKDLQGKMPWQPAVAWDPKAMNSAIYSLSGGNLVAAQVSGDNTYNTVRALGPKLAGKWHVEFEMTNIVAAGAHVGFSTDQELLNTWLGTTSASVGVYTSDVWFQGVQLYAYPSGGGHIATSVRVVIEVDLTLANPVMWIAFGASGGYENGNPAAGTGGLNIAAIMNNGAIYPAFNGLRVGNSCTIKPKSSDFVRTPTTGFLPWGS